MSTGVPFTTESAGWTGPDHDGVDELRANLRQADPGVLVAVLAQLTGDPTVAERFAPKITHVPDPPEQAGVTDPETAAQLIDEIVTALREPRRADAVPADDLDLFARVAPIALGGTIDPEYLGLLLEQGGFQPSQPVLPRTAKLPADFRVVIIGAGIAGITAALACADAGIDYQIIERNDEVGGTWYTTTYPGIGVDTPSAYYSLSRDINGDWSSYYPQGAEYQAYLVSVANKNDLRRNTRFGTE
ncbi:FAD-dependent oxidoreductase, partial [Mycobacterium intracellulare]